MQEQDDKNPEEEKPEATQDTQDTSAVGSAVEDVLKEVMEDGGDFTGDLGGDLGGDIVPPETAPPAEPTPEEQIAALNDQLLRSLAEIDNTRRRAERDRSEALKYGAATLARDILSVADNLNRALASLEETAIADETHKAFIEGVTATERDLQAILQRHNISQINPKGEKFDPNLHEALFEVPLEHDNMGNSDQAGMVVEVVEVGYMLDDRLLRPAKVGISKAV